MNNKSSYVLYFINTLPWINYILVNNKTFHTKWKEKNENSSNSYEKTPNTFYSLSVHISFISITWISNSMDILILMIYLDWLMIYLDWCEVKVKTTIVNIKNVSKKLKSSEKNNLCHHCWIKPYTGLCFRFQVERKFWVKNINNFIFTL